MLNRQVFLVLALVLMAGTAHTQGFWWEKVRAKVINKKNFNEIVGKDSYVFLEVYSKTCGYCKEMYPEFNKLVDEYNGANSKRKDVIIAKMDGEENYNLAVSYGATSFPMLFLFKPGTTKFPDNYDFGRTFQDMKGYIETHLPAGGSTDYLTKNLQEPKWLWMRTTPRLKSWRRK